LLGVVPVYLLPCLADFLDHEELAFSLDDSFDLGFFVARDEHEVIALADDRRIAVRPNLDRLDARSPPALAVERQRCRHGVLLGALLDPFVHIAEHLLVPRRASGEVHRACPV
jgi:hypothetical protein